MPQTRPRPRWFLYQLVLVVVAALHVGETPRPKIADAAQLSAVSSRVLLIRHSSLTPRPPSADACLRPQLALGGLRLAWVPGQAAPRPWLLLGVDHGERLGTLRQCPHGAGRWVEGACQFGAGGPKGLWPSLSAL